MPEMKMRSIKMLQLSIMCCKTIVRVGPNILTKLLTLCLLLVIVLVIGINNNTNIVVYTEFIICSLNE